MKKGLTHSEAGKLGAAASRAICERKHLAFVAAYEQNPVLCEVCQKPIPFEQRRNRFCCRSCAASYNNHGKKRYPDRPRASCIHCGEKIPNCQNKLFCSNECRHAFGVKQIESAILTGGEVGARQVREFLFRTRERRCESCGLTQWLDQPIPLEQDHTNGNPTDNSLENLRLICPNCHALTPTYKGKNKGNGRVKRRERYRQGKSY